mmetsp:Transcript_93098/g.241017  ORF Transcript_93098/g.241017 Transcript_93098/m.241017 type:complete len:212 (-) Transcript_93098:289-924(-)
METPPPPGRLPCVSRSFSMVVATRSRIKSCESPVRAPHHSSSHCEASNLTPASSSSALRCSASPSSYRAVTSSFTRCQMASFPVAMPVESAPPMFFCSLASLSKTIGRSSVRMSRSPKQAVVTARVKGELKTPSGFSSRRNQTYSICTLPSSSSLLSRLPFWEMAFDSASLSSDSSTRRAAARSRRRSSSAWRRPSSDKPWSFSHIMLISW